MLDNITAFFPMAAAAQSALRNGIQGCDDAVDVRLYLGGGSGEARRCEDTAAALPRSRPDARFAPHALHVQVS